MTDSTRPTLAASAWLNRSAAQISKGVHRKEIGSFLEAAPNTILPTTNRHSSRAPASTASAWLQCNRGFALQSNNAGATTRSPDMSPNHQVHQIPRYPAHGAKPPSASDVTPTVALTMVLRIPA